MVVTEISIALKATDMIRGFRQNRRKVTVLAHLAYFPSPGTPQMCFVKVTNRSPRRPITITHVWFDTTPQVDLVNPERPLTKTLGLDEQWETWIPVSELHGAENVETLARVVLANNPKRPIKSRLNKHVRPYGEVAGP
jgi:hypothetical protein